MTLGQAHDSCRTKKAVFGASGAVAGGSDRERQKCDRQVVRPL